jgi:hypothetical protein
MPGRSSGGPAAVHGATALLTEGRPLRSPSVSNQPTLRRRINGCRQVHNLPATAQAGLTRPPAANPACVLGAELANLPRIAIRAVVLPQPLGAGLRGPADRPPRPGRCLARVLFP